MHYAENATECMHSALTNKLMIRVTNYFDAQIRVPLQVGVQSQPRDAPNGASTGPRLKSHLGGPLPSDKPMTQEQILSWYEKILEGVKQRYRKLQRLTR